MFIVYLHYFFYIKILYEKIYYYIFYNIFYTTLSAE